MLVERLLVSKPFMYVWLKHITGYNLSVHCAKSLLGTYDERVNKSRKEYEPFELENGVYYLCGVSLPYVWKNNFHFAFMPCEGQTAIKDYNGISIIVQNAVELPISNKYIDWSLPKAHLPAYYTCRNWQFANFLRSSKILS